MRKMAIIFLVLLGALWALPAQAVSVGDPAPRFTAISNREEVRLEDFLGKKNVVISFYFNIYTPA